MSFTSYGNVSTRACTTNSYQVSCTVGLYPAAVGVWGTADASVNGSTGVPTIATTRFYLDPSTNATVSSSVICNWEQYSSAYVVPGKNASEAGYYTVNSDCALVGVLRRDQEFNWRYPAISATYPNPKLDLGSKFETWYNTCPTSTGLPEQTTTTSIVYSDTWSQKWPMPFYWMPELSEYLPDVPEVTSCSIYLYGSPQTLKAASHLTENVLLPRTTTAAQPADTPQPEAPQTTQPNGVPDTPTQPTNEATSPQRPSQEIPSPTAGLGDGLPADNAGEGDNPAQSEEPDPAPINQDPIWSAIGDAAEQASGTAAASPTQVGSLSQPNNADEPEDDDAVPIVSQTQDSSNDITDFNSENEPGGSGDQGSTLPAEQSNANSSGNTDTGTTDNDEDSGSGLSTQNASDSVSSEGSTSSSSISVVGDDSESGEVSSNNPFVGGTSEDDDSSAEQGIVLATVKTQTDTTSGSTATDDKHNPEGVDAAAGEQDSIADPTIGAALTFAGPEATPAVTLVPVDGGSTDAIESIIAAGSASFISGALVIGTQTIRPGGPAVTISTEGLSPVVSVAAERMRTEVAVTISGASGPQKVAFSAEDDIEVSQIQDLISHLSVQALESAIVIASRTLVPGGTAATISEQDATYVLSLPTAGPSGAPPGPIVVSKLNDAESESLDGYICSIIGGCVSQSPSAEESFRSVVSLSTLPVRSSRAASISATMSTENTETSTASTSESPTVESAASTEASDSSTSRAHSSSQSAIVAVVGGIMVNLLMHFA